MTNDPASETRAKQRFATLAIVRFTGVLTVLAGILIAQGVIALPAWIGYILAVLGMFEVFFLPTLLARRWKSPDA